MNNSKPTGKTSHTRKSPRGYVIHNKTGSTGLSSPMASSSSQSYRTKSTYNHGWGTSLKTCKTGLSSSNGPIDLTNDTKICLTDLSSQQKTGTTSLKYPSHKTCYTGLKIPKKQTSTNTKTLPNYNSLTKPIKICSTDLPTTISSQASLTSSNFSTALNNFYEAKLNVQHQFFKCFVSCLFYFNFKLSRNKKVVKYKTYKNNFKN